MTAFNKILVILNPTAGQRNTARIRSVIESFMMEKGHNFVLRESKERGDASRWARSAVAEGFDLVAAAGGDGTVSEAADGIMRSGGRVTLAQIPTGTTNFAARALSIPMSIRDSLGLIESGKSERFDIGYLPEHDRYFVFIMGTGYDGRLIHDTPAELKKKLGFIGYVMFGIRNAPSVRPVQMELEIDDEVKHLRAHTVMVINIGSIQSLGFSFAPDIDPHDGKLNISIMSTRSWWGTLQMVLRILTRRFHGFPDLKHVKASRIRVTSDPPFPVEIDGDPLGTTPFLAEVIHDAMPFLVPASYSRESYKQDPS